MTEKSNQTIWPSLIHTLLLGPILSMLAAPFLGVALYQGIALGGGLEGLGLLALGLAPVATVAAVPLVKIWLRHQRGGYWGMLASGGIWGVIWAQAIEVAFSLFGFTGESSWGGFAVFAGFPMGVAHAAVFWASLNYRLASKTDRPGLIALKLSLIVGITLPVVWLPQFVIYLIVVSGSL